MDELPDLLKTLTADQSNLLPALHLTQKKMGWVSRESMHLIGKHLKLTEAQVFGAASFYSELRLTKPPKTVITWCSGPTCRILGSDRIRVILENTLDCEIGKNDERDVYGLWLGQCNGTCEQAPQVWVNGRVLGRLTLVDAVNLAIKIKAGETVVADFKETIEIQPIAREPANNSLKKQSEM